MIKVNCHQTRFRWTEGKAACNKGIAASGAGRWNNRQQFAIRLPYRREVINLAFSFYLQPLVKTRQQFRAGRYKIPRLTAIPDTLHATLKANFQVLHRLATVLLRQILESRLQHTKPLAGDILPVVYYFG